jgi:hypothetical protein
MTEKVKTLAAYIIVIGAIPAMIALFKQATAPR